MEFWTAHSPVENSFFKEKGWRWSNSIIHLLLLPSWSNSWETAPALYSEEAGWTATLVALRSDFGKPFRGCFFLSYMCIILQALLAQSNHCPWGCKQVSVDTSVCLWPCTDSAVSFVSPDTTDSELSTLRRFSPLSQYVLLPSLANCFLVPVSSSGLTVMHRKRTSRTSLSSTMCLLDLALAIPRICFSINTKVQHLQDSRVMCGDSLVCCRCALAQLGANPSKEPGCCWRQRKLLAITTTITQSERRAGSCQP